MATGFSRLLLLAASLAMGLSSFHRGGIGPAGAAQPSMEDTPPMRFVVVRSSEPGCEPVCAEWISAEGTIRAKTPGELKSLLKTLGGRKLPIVLFSPGGDVDAAMALGRLIRQNKLDSGR